MAKQDIVQQIKDRLAKTKVLDRSIETELRTSFMDYAMSVIVSRALPDARDGLKPVQRRILFAADGLGMRANTPYKKSARLVGEVIGKYHPHGDGAVYEAMVRMAQDFSLRHPLMDGHGNFGSIDGDAAAAMRYTEIRLSRIAGEMIRDLDKETVLFGDNYDGSEREPTVMPSHFPNLLVNGGTGIAVGMATNIPPHNLGEIIDGVVLMIDNPNATTDELAQCISGPDFPTAGEIIGAGGIDEYFATGRGSVRVRAKVSVEDGENGKGRLIVNELPYNVNKARLVSRIADLATEKLIEGISDLRDESSREGIRVVIETRKDAVPEVVLNNLYKQTELQTTFSVNMIALTGGRPKLLNMRDCLQLYVDHAVSIVVNRSIYDNRKAQERAHILEGLSKVVSNIDEVVALFKRSNSPDEAQKALMVEFDMTEIQAKAVVDMRLGRLTGLERDKIEKEFAEVKALIADLEGIINSKERQLKIVKEELLAVKENYADERRTVINRAASGDIDDESLIPVEDVVVTMSAKGYLKRLPVDTYRTQHRGGVGVMGTTLNEEDDVAQVVVTTTHTDLLFFTDVGKVYRIRAHKVPALGRQAKGIPAINMIGVEKGERVMALLPMADYIEGYLFFVTKLGVVKRSPVSEFERIMSNGKIATSIREGDSLFAVMRTFGGEEIFLGSSSGHLCRFNEDEVRSMGRNAAGVRGISLDDNAEVVGASSSSSGSLVLSVGAKGLGKMTETNEYRLTKRGARGVLAFKVTPKTGGLVSTLVVKGDEDALLMTNSGQLIRINLASVRVAGRSTSGVILMDLEDKQKIQSVAVMAAQLPGEPDDPGESAPTGETEGFVPQPKPDEEAPEPSETVKAEAPGGQDEPKE